MLCNSKELVNFNCPLNQDLFGGEIGKLVTAVKLESQSTRRSPLPRATRHYLGFRTVRLSCWHLDAHVGSWCRHFCCNLASPWASTTIETRWDEMNRVNIDVPWCSTFAAKPCRMPKKSGWDWRYGEVMTRCDEPRDMFITNYLPFGPNWIHCHTLQVRQMFFYQREVDPFVDECWSRVMWL